MLGKLNPAIIYHVKTLRPTNGSQNKEVDKDRRHDMGTVRQLDVIR